MWREYGAAERLMLCESRRGQQVILEQPRPPNTSSPLQQQQFFPFFTTTTTTPDTRSRSVTLIVLNCAQETTALPFNLMSAAGNATGGGSASAAGQAPAAAKPFQTKLVLLGEAAVGKSSVVLRFVSDDFQEYKEPTIGAAFLTVSGLAPYSWLSPDCASTDRLPDDFLPLIHLLPLSKNAGWKIR